MKTNIINCSSLQIYFYFISITYIHNYNIFLIKHTLTFLNQKLQWNKYLKSILLN